MSEKILTFEGMANALSDLLDKVDQLQQSIINIAKTKTPEVKKDELFISLDEACTIVHRTKTTMYGLCRKRLIPHYKHGRKLIFKQSELIEWVSKCKKETSTQTLEELHQSMSAGIRHKPSRMVF
jgi:excisionase family DNA binding protein